LARWIIEFLSCHGLDFHPDLEKLFNVCLDYLYQSKAPSPLQETVFGVLSHLIHHLRNRDEKIKYAVPHKRLNKLKLEMISLYDTEKKRSTLYSGYLQSLTDFLAAVKLHRLQNSPRKKDKKIKNDDALYVAIALAESLDDGKEGKSEKISKEKENEIEGEDKKTSDKSKEEKPEESKKLPKKDEPEGEKKEGDKKIEKPASIEEILLHQHLLIDPSTTDPELSKDIFVSLQNQNRASEQNFETYSEGYVGNFDPSWSFDGSDFVDEEEELRRVIVMSMQGDFKEKEISKSSEKIQEPAEKVSEKPKEIVWEDPKEKSQEKPKQIVTEAPKEKSEEKPIEIVKEIPKEKSQEVLKETTKEVPKQIPKEIQKEVPKEITKEKLEEKLPQESKETKPSEKIEVSGEKKQEKASIEVSEVDPKEKKEISEKTEEKVGEKVAQKVAEKSGEPISEKVVE